MAKKYLSLEEAAELLKISPDDLMKLRENGDLRGFADRGSWKFREQDLNEFARSREADSSPDVPMLASDDLEKLSSSDSDVRLMLDETLIPTGADEVPPELSDSLSDVRLSEDSKVSLSDSDSDVQIVGSGTDADINLQSGPDSDSDVNLVGSDSDSDVRIAEESGEYHSDIRLAGTDSDIRLTSDPDSGPNNDMDLLQTTTDSDSDVNLIPSSGVDLEGSDSDVSAVVSGEGAGVTLEVGDEDSAAMAEGSSIVIKDDPDPDSGLTLETAESGIDLSGSDSDVAMPVGSGVGSGVALDADSGITLEAADSGISLEAADSGISLEAADSGISLDLDDDSGIALEAGHQTMPMQAMPEGGTDFDQTQMEMPTVGHDSDFELAGLDDDDADDGTGTSVLLFDAEDDDTGSDALRDLSGVAAGGATMQLETDTSSEFDMEADDDDDDFDDFDDDDDEDVFGAGDDDFEDDFESEEAGDFAAAPAAGRAARVEQDWGMLTFVGLLISSGLMSLCCLVAFDLIRTMWGSAEPGPISNSLLGVLGGMF